MELNVRPVPIPDPVTQFYWDSAKVGKLAVQGFEGTDILQHPPSPVPEVPGGGARVSRSPLRSAAAGPCSHSPSCTSRSIPALSTRCR